MQLPQMPAQLDLAAIMRALDWAYDGAINGVPGGERFGLGAAEDLARSYTRRGGSRRSQADQIILWHTTSATATGFVTGLGGALALPVAIPANIAAVLLIQLRMVAAIAIVGGYDVRDDQARALSYACLCGSSAGDVLKGVGIDAGLRLGRVMLMRIPGAALTRINQAVGFRLLTKFGTTGVINLGKALPILGGVIGGAFDGVGTHAVGAVASRTFIGEGNPD